MKTPLVSLRSSDDPVSGKALAAGSLSHVLESRERQGASHRFVVSCWNPVSGKALAAGSLSHVGIP